MNVPASIECTSKARGDVITEPSDISEVTPVNQPPGLWSRAATGVRWTMLNNATSAGSELFRSVVLSHYLYPADFGLMAMVTVLYGLVQMYTDFVLIMNDR